MQGGTTESSEGDSKAAEGARNPKVDSFVRRLPEEAEGHLGRAKVNYAPEGRLECAKVNYVPEGPKPPSG